MSPYVPNIQHKNWNSGGKFKREGTHVYLWLTHVDIRQKPTHYCKAITLQLNINSKKKWSSKSVCEASPSSPTMVNLSWIFINPAFLYILPHMYVHALLKTILFFLCVCVCCFFLFYIISLTHFAGSSLLCGVFLQLSWARATAAVASRRGGFSCCVA